MRVIETENARAVSVAGPYTLSPIFNVRFVPKADVSNRPGLIDALPDDARDRAGKMRLGGADATVAALQMISP